MADTKLSALPELAVEPSLTDEFYINDGGVSKRIIYDTLFGLYLQDLVDDLNPILGGDLDSNGFSTLNIPMLDFDTAAGVTVAQGQIAWNADEETFDMGLNGAVLQAGQEIHYHARNATGSLIPDGTAVMATGTVGASGRITIGLMDGSNIANAKFFLGITTEDIAAGTDGKVTAFGKVRGIKTDYATWADGDVLWVDNASAGDLTNVEPTSGSRLPIAFIVHSHATNGTIAVRATDGTYLAEGHDTQIASPATGEVLQHNGTAWINDKVDFPNLGTDLAEAVEFFDGSFLDQQDVTVTSNGNIITLSIEKDGGGDLRIVFDSAVTVLDTTPAATITLTAGSDTSPQINYIYVLQSTGVLTLSTSEFPTGVEFAPVATVFCQSAASLQTDCSYKVHVWTDHTSSDVNNGHLSHVNHWIRHQAATWLNGIALTPTITVNGGSEDNVDIATASGQVLQLHKHSYPAFNTSTGSEVYVVNDFSAAYTKITDLNAADEDSAGNAIANKQYTNLVVWGVVSEADADCKLFINLPSGFHGSDSTATVDAESLSNYTIPDEYRGTGFLIARLTLKYTTGSSGTWELIENISLREDGAAGGTRSASGSEFIDNVFRVLNVTDETKELAFDVSGITTATTRTITMPDHDVTLGRIVLGIAASDEGTDLTTGTGKTEFQIVDGAFTLTAIYATLTTAPTGSIAIIDVNLNGTTLMTTNKISIDAGEKTSDTAATQPSLTTTALTENGVITVDMDQIGSSVAGSGLKIYLVGYWT